MNVARGLPRIAWGTAIGVAAGRLAMIAAADLNPSTLFFASPDDAFYYLQIAWNLAHGRGSTFDGIHPTNGYQPAWCVLLALVAPFVPSREALYRASAWLASALLITAALGLARLVRGFFRNAWPLAAFLLWTFAPRADWLLVLESPLNACTLALVLATALRAAADPRRTGRWLATGIALAASILTRLDNLAVALPFLLLLREEPASSSGPRRRPSRVAALVGPSVVIVGAYLVVNHLAIGAALPVSGTAKLRMHHDVLVQDAAVGASVVGEIAHAVAASWLAGPGHHLGGWLVRDPAEAPLVASLATVGIALYAVVLAWKRPASATPSEVGDSAPRLVFTSVAALRVWRAFTAGALLHFAGMIAFVGVFPREWHFVPEAMWLTLALVCGVPRLVERIVRPARPTWLRRVLAVAITVGLAAWPAWLAREGLHRARVAFVFGHRVVNHQIQMTRHFGAELPAGTRVGAWNAGYLAYFSDLVVVNLDGLVNRPGFTELVDRIGWERYFQDEGIRYVIDTWGGAFTMVASRGRILERQWFQTFEYVLVEVGSLD